MVFSPALPESDIAETPAETLHRLSTRRLPINPRLINDQMSNWLLKFLARQFSSDQGSTTRHDRHRPAHKIQSITQAKPQSTAPRSLRFSANTTSIACFINCRLGLRITGHVRSHDIQPQPRSVPQSTNRYYSTILISVHKATRSCLSL